MKHLLEASQLAEGVTEGDMGPWHAVAMDENSFGVPGAFGLVRFAGPGSSQRLATKMVINDTNWTASFDQAKHDAEELARQLNEERGEI